MELILAILAALDLIEEYSLKYTVATGIDLEAYVDTWAPFHKAMNRLKKLDRDGTMVQRITKAMLNVASLGRALGNNPFDVDAQIAYREADASLRAYLKALGDILE